MLKYCMRMQGVGLLVAAVLCGPGWTYFMKDHESVQLEKEESFAAKIANQLDQNRL